MSSEKSIDQPETKETDTDFMEYKSLPYQEGQDQIPMQMGEIEKSDFLTLNRKVDKLLLEIDRSAEESNRKFNEQRNWIRTMREEMIKDADYAKSKFEKLEADLQYLGAKQEFLLIFTRI